MPDHLACIKDTDQDLASGEENALRFQGRERANSQMTGAES